MISTYESMPKEQLAILGSLIKINRLQQNMSQQALSDGICVPSYLSKIENGDIVPSLEMISDLFENLGIKYQDDQVFLEEKHQQMEQFYDELNVSGFAESEQLFNVLEQVSEQLIHSPLVIEYYLMRFAHFCGTPKRTEFMAAKTILKSVLTQLTPKQCHRYYFYQGIDVLFLKGDLIAANTYFKSSNHYDQSGNSLHFLGLSTYMQGSYFEALEYLQVAQRQYMKEGNLVAMVYSFECLGIISYKMGSFTRAIELLESATSYAKKLKRKDLMVMPLCIKGYLYYQRELFEQATAALEKASQLKEELALPWPDLELIDFLKDVVASKYHDTPYTPRDFSQCLNIEEKVHIGLQLLQTSYYPNESQKDVETLYQTYKQLPMMKLYLDEMVNDAMKCYYIRARKYKEACQLKE